jgi:hypothetical protein
VTALETQARAMIDVLWRHKSAIADHYWTITIGQREFHLVNYCHREENQDQSGYICWTEAWCFDGFYRIMPNDNRRFEFILKGDPTDIAAFERDALLLMLGFT